MAAFVLGIFIGGIVGSCVMAVLASGADAERIPLDEVRKREADAYRQGKLIQALAQSEKDSARAKKAATTRKARQTAADLALESEAF